MNITEVFKIKTGTEKLNREQLFTVSSNVTVSGHKLKGAGGKFRTKISNNFLLEWMENIHSFSQKS